MTSPKDYFSRIQRLARRALRSEDTSKVAEVVRFNKREAGKSLTTQNAGLHAVSMVRQILDNYALPGSPKLSYSGIRNMRQASTTGKLDSGVVTIFAEFKTATGVPVGLDFPVEIRNGELIEPSVAVFNGSPRIIAQSTFDDIVASNTMFEEIPVRRLYEPPMEQSQVKDALANRIKTERVNRGMFSASLEQENLRRAVKGLPPIKAQEESPTEEEFGLDPTIPSMSPDVKTIPSGVAKEPLALGLQPGEFDPMQPLPLGQEPDAPAGVHPQVGRPTKNWVQELNPNLTPYMPAQEAPKFNRGDNSNGNWSISFGGPSDPTTTVPGRGRGGSKQSQYRAEGDEKRDPHRNKMEEDFVDPAEVKEFNDILPGSEHSLKETLEVKDRGGAVVEYAKGSKVKIVKDLAGDNKEFIVRFEDGQEALVERCFLAKSAQLGKAGSHSRVAWTPVPQRYILSNDDDICFEFSVIELDDRSGFIAYDEDSGDQLTISMPSEGEAIAELEREISKSHLNVYIEKIGSLSKTAIIRHEKGKWNVYTHDGKKLLGSHPTKEKAQAQLSAIEISKHSQLNENPRIENQRGGPVVIHTKPCSQCGGEEAGEIDAWDPYSETHYTKPNVECDLCDGRLTEDIYDCECPECMKLAFELGQITEEELDESLAMNKQSSDLLSKVSAEVEAMRADGISDIEARQAVLTKYGNEIACLLFDKK